MGDSTRDQRVSERVLADPKVQQGVKEAKERVRKGETRPGKTADELLNLAREQSRVES